MDVLVRFYSNVDASIQILKCRFMPIYPPLKTNIYLLKIDSWKMQVFLLNGPFSGVMLNSMQKKVQVFFHVIQL